MAVGLVLTLVVADGEGEGEEEQDGPPTVAATPTPEPVQEPSESESPGVSAAPSATPPEGYEVFVDDEGFRIAVPQGWTRSEVESAYGMPVVNYRDADGSHRLQVFEVAEASPAASFELFLSEEEFQPKGFRKLALEELDQGDFAGSRLEYLADSLRGEPDLGTWHVYDLRFVAADGRVYALAAYGPDADGRDDELELVTYASAWFCPPGAECSAPLLR
ncbi:hypothetical protein [Streptomyces sp. JJ36]|uniref:hypothetical protein n=1 Tax=Streptomyces sp. JJ36 TaxID=2736645 RepID=UPI001F39B554|nr:hypothetical protein [Streptomyces sp. JJ36]MCF6522280.1 hypothetical protein [Streptomyces sp. JJ36]